MLGRLVWVGDSSVSDNTSLKTVTEANLWSLGLLSGGMSGVDDTVVCARVAAALRISPEVIGLSC